MSSALLTQLNRSLDRNKSERILAENETLLERKRLQEIVFLCDLLNDDNNNNGDAFTTRTNCGTPVDTPSGLHRFSELSDLSTLESRDSEGSADQSPNNSSSSGGDNDDNNGDSCETLNALRIEETLVSAELKRLLATDIDDTDDDEDLKEFRDIERGIKVAELQKNLEDIRFQLANNNNNQRHSPTAPLADSESVTTGTDKESSPEASAEPEEGVVCARVRQRVRQLRPLTMYMPVVDEELDLCQHVLTLGHELADKPQVCVTRFTCSGYLHKLCQKWDRKWRKRYFLFDRLNKVFVYFKNKNLFLKSRKPNGGVYFDEIHDVYVDHTRIAAKGDDSTRSVFIVGAASRQFVLSTDAPEVMRIWVDVIFTGAQAYQDFRLNY